MKKVEYLMEMFKLLINFAYLLVTGLAFLGYNLFFIEENKIVFIIFLGVGVFLLSILFVVLKKINLKILDYIKEEE